jgi:hypothetical protein
MTIATRDCDADADNDFPAAWRGLIFSLYCFLEFVEALR